MEPRSVSAPLAAGLVVLGLVLATGPALAAGFSICGVSGCTGGGFGRATDPDLTRVLLLLTGVVAGLPLAAYALVRNSAAGCVRPRARRPRDPAHRARHRLGPPRLPAQRLRRDVPGGGGLTHPWRPFDCWGSGPPLGG